MILPDNNIINIQASLQQYDYTKNILKYFEKTSVSRKFRGTPSWDAQSCITITDMEEEKFRYMRVPATKEELGKVTNMKGTFLKEGSDGFKIPAAKTERQKVTNMVGTFLKEGSEGFKIPAAKTERQKVTNTVGTFLKEGSGGF